MAADEIELDELRRKQRHFEMEVDDVKKQEVHSQQVGNLGNKKVVPIEDSPGRHPSKIFKRTLNLE